ncbi:hypothetical protein QQS21_009261 [Conoideocrella luteorostrata]|uniref:Cytochrome P450 monooxygenase n=1 Tax=Conoideocrella luteorostrata TaxID=1105319 RepID=A0AAJ0FVT5_9HYPO|nr:hypothetical protein QQS21_009261 [Conoideocrella luteorostrata]
MGTNHLALLRVLTRPEHIQLVFKDSEKHKKAINNNSGYLMSQLLGSCVGLISGMEWKTARFVLERPFLHNASNNYVPMIQKHVLQHLDKLHRGTDLKQGFLHPADDLKLLPFWIVAEIFYGSLSDSMAAELQVLAQDREDLFKQVIRGGVSRFTFSKYLSTETNKLLDNFQRGWKAFNNEAARRAKETNQGEPIVYFYEMVTAGVLTEAQLLQTLDEALFANLDVTTGGISWNLVYLATHESYQAAIQQEVQSAPDKEEYIRSNSTLLAACISESSRLQPLAAFSIPQAAPTARVIDGYIIPAGTDFIVDSYALNIRNEFWGKDADVYRPERFLERKNTETRYHFWRFGFGPRQCMGKYVADLILRVLLVHVVENYNLSIDSVEDIWRRNPESWITHPHMRIRCWKKDNAV